MEGRSMSEQFSYHTHKQGIKPADVAPRRAVTDEERAVCKMAFMRGQEAFQVGQPMPRVPYPATAFKGPTPYKAFVQGWQNASGRAAPVYHQHRVAHAEPAAPLVADRTPANVLQPVYPTNRLNADGKPAQGVQPEPIRLSQEEFARRFTSKKIVNALWSYGMAWTKGNTALVEDLIQDVYLSAYKGYDARQPLEGWLIHIFKRRHMDYLRKQRRPETNQWERDAKIEAGEEPRKVKPAEWTTPFAEDITERDTIDDPNAINVLDDTTLGGTIQGTIEDRERGSGIADNNAKYVQPPADPILEDLIDASDERLRDWFLTNLSPEMKIRAFEQLFQKEAVKTVSDEEFAAATGAPLRVVRKTKQLVKELMAGEPVSPMGAEPIECPETTYDPEGRQGKIAAALVNNRREVGAKHPVNSWGRKA
jgi:DNA-directed RNA polymerase specialized sigma24 family protein